MLNVATSYAKCGTAVRYYLSSSSLELRNSGAAIRLHTRFHTQHAALFPMVLSLTYIAIAKLTKSYFYRMTIAYKSRLRIAWSGLVLIPIRGAGCTSKLSTS